MAEPILTVDHLVKSYDGKTNVLDNVSFAVKPGEVIVVVGPSGCGKSTLLRCLNGLEPVQAGRVKLGSETVAYGGKNLAALRQRIGMVFQSYELFPHLTVLENILLAPTKVQKRPRAEVQQEAEALLDRVNLLNKESGMLGLSGVSSDFRDLEQAAEKENHRATVALEIFEYRVRKMIAEYAAAMGGVDVVVFTAGVGENAPETRAHILHGLEFMGITCDPEKNNCRGKEQIISQDGAPVIVMVIPTNEELMIAQDTMELVLDQE